MTPCSSRKFFSKDFFSFFTEGPSTCIAKHYYLVVSVDKGCALRNLCPLYHRERAKAALSTLSAGPARTLKGSKGVVLHKGFLGRLLLTPESALVTHITYIKARLAVFALPKEPQELR